MEGTNTKENKSPEVGRGKRTFNHIPTIQIAIKLEVGPDGMQSNGNILN